MNGRTMFYLKVTLVLSAFTLAGCNVEEDRRRGTFQYCLGAASPASADAIKACQEAAWPTESKQADWGSK